MTVDTLVTEIERLSPADRENLYHRLGVLDQTKMRGAEIKIDDWQGKDRVSPRATIEYLDGSEETIDIIESVKANAISLAHPAILCAIQRWEKAIIYGHALALETNYFKNQTEYFEIATRHLERLLAAIVSGAKKRQIRTKPAIDLFIVGLGLQDDYVVLHKAWELLAEKEIKNIRNEWQKLKRIEEVLNSDWKRKEIVQNIQSSVGQLPKLPCIQIKFPPTKAAQITELLTDLQSELITSVFYEDEEDLQKYLNFLKSQPTSEKVSYFPLPSRLIAMKLIPEASQFMQKDGYVASSKIWDGSDMYWFEFEDGSTASIKIADALEILGIKSKKLKTEIAFAFGLKDCLANDPRADFLKVTRVDVVCRFLRSDSGKKFINAKKKIVWRVFINAFDAWRLPLANRSVQKYRSSSKQWIRERFQEKQQKNEYIGTGNIQDALKFFEIDRPSHYAALSRVIEIDTGQSLLPTWFNSYSYSGYVDSKKFPVLPCTAKV